MRTALAASLAFALAAACGDDPKQGGQPAPAAGAPSRDERPTPPGPSETFRVLPGWQEAHVGDYATWEVRVAGVDGVTTLTWRVVGVEPAQVRYSIESKSQGAAGKVSGSTNVEETHPRAPAFAPAGATERVIVAGKPVDALKSVVGAGGSETTVWYSPDVPLSGVVKSIGPGGAEQTLVAWGRGGG